MAEIKFTMKQLEILAVIKKGKLDGSPMSVYDIIENLSYPVKRDALLHSIRHLVNAGYVERRDSVVIKGKAIRPFMVTSKALTVI